MSLFTIDAEKCKRDGICVAECPFGLLEMKNSESTPIEGADEMCFNCGHCVAICPHGALSLKTMAVEECSLIQKKLKITPGLSNSWGDEGPFVDIRRRL